MGAQVPHWAPQTTGLLHGEEDPHALERDPSSFEGQKTCIWETQRAVENTGSALKRTHTKSHMLQDPEQRLSYERSWVRPLLILKSCLVRKEATNAHLGMQMLTTAILGPQSARKMLESIIFEIPPTNPASHPKACWHHSCDDPGQATSKAGT